jgi:glutaredoxin
MTVETLGTCKKHQLPLDLHGECQLCRLSEMPSQAPSLRGGRWVVMALVALVAGGVAWAVASFEPSEAPTPTRGVPNNGTRAAAPAVQHRAQEDQAVKVPPTADTASEASAASEVAATEQTADADQADNQAQQWARAREQVQIDMYTTSSSDVCRQAREYMQDNGIAFTEHNIEEDKDADRRVRELDPERTTPTFEIDDLVLVGFSPDDFEATRTQAAGKYLSEEHH